MQGLYGIGRRLAGAWRGLAARERWLTGLLAVVALSVAVVSAADWSAAQREVNALARADLVARQDAVRRAAGQVSDAGTRQLRSIADRSIRGTDIWMARVAVERYLAAAAAESGVTEPRIRIAEAVEGDAATPVLKAEISGPYDGAALVRLLTRLAADRHAYFVDGISADRGESAEFQLSLSFPVTLDAGTPTS